MTPRADMRASLLVSALLVGLATAAGAGDAPRRIASLNLCADQLLLALADPDRIAALGPLSRDRAYSRLAERAETFPRIRGAEDLLMRDVDLVLIGPHDDRYTRSVLAERGIRTEIVPPWSSIDRGRAEIRRVAALLGRPERGEALVGEIDAALARLPRVGPGTTALALERRGWAPGAATLVHDVLRRMGFSDPVGGSGQADGGFVPMERLVLAAPDMVVLDRAPPEAEDQGTAWLLHPAMLAALPPERRLVADARLTICGGPSTPELIDALGEQVRRSGLALP